MAADGLVATAPPGPPNTFGARFLGRRLESCLEESSLPGCLAIPDSGEGRKPVPSPVEVIIGRDMPLLLDKSLNGFRDPCFCPFDVAKFWHGAILFV